jgi:hypothetical protein
MKNQFELITQFFSLKPKCPICGNAPLRKLLCAFMDGKEFLYESDPRRDSYDYNNFVFIKYQQPITVKMLEENKAKDYVDAAPTIINIGALTPPSLQSLKALEAYVSCYTRGIHYQLSSKLPSFEPTSERLVHEGLDLMITPTEIKQINGTTKIPMTQNMILKFQPQEATNFLKKLMILQ